MTIRFKEWLASGLIALASLPAQAALLMSTADMPAASVNITIGFDGPPTGYGLPTPVAVGDGVTLSTVGGPVSVGVAPDPGAWSLGENGFWAGLSKTFAGVDGDFDPVTGDVAALVFDFGDLRVRAVGGIMNFDPSYTYGPGLPLLLYIAAYDALGSLIEDWELPAINTPNQLNAGAFYGISSPDSRDIARLVISGPFAVVDDLRIAAVPEPSTYALMAAGFFAAGFMRWRQKH